MIDDKKIEEAAINKCGFISSEFYSGAKWMQKELFKDLWHPMQEEPKLVGEDIIIDMFIKGESYTMVQKYMVGVKFPSTIKTIRWISDWDSFLPKSGDNVKMIRWCYFKDLLPKEGGEQ